jgi:predicted Zn-dependent protease
MLSELRKESTPGIGTVERPASRCSRFPPGSLYDQDGKIAGWSGLWSDRNVFTTLHNIDAIGSDLDMNQGGGCGKANLSPLPVSNGSPHIRIRIACWRK